MMRLHRRDHVPVRTGLVPVLWVAVVVAAALGLGVLVRQWNPYVAVGIASLAAAVVGGLGFLAFPVLRHEVGALLARRGGGATVHSRI